MSRIVITICILSVIGLAWIASKNADISNLAAVIGSSQKVIFAECVTKFSDLSISSFEIQQAHINEDSIPDGIVRYKTSDACGSAGCVYELCISNTTGGLEHIPFGYAANELSTQNTKTNGMADLILNGDKNTRMTWDGSQYQLSE